MKCLGLHNKPTAEVHLGYKLTGPKKEEGEEEVDGGGGGEEEEEESLISQIYFSVKLYMFWTVPLSIIRSLSTVHSAMVYVIQVL
jgi:hypothetical protein